MQGEQRTPPPWGDDPLSKFMSDAEFNARACVVNYPDIYDLLRRAHELLKRVCEVLEKDPADRNLGAPRMLIARSHSAVLAAARLAMSGQGFEAQPVLRAAIEQVWYALHIAKDSNPPARAKIWWDRDVSLQAEQACKDEFKVGTVRRTHEGLDTATAAAMHSLYEGTIDFGAHPNQGGVAGSLKLDRSTKTASVGFLHAGTPAQLAALKGAIDVAIGVTKMVALIYPERLRIARIDEEVGPIVQYSAEVFGGYAQAVRRAS
jgi:hypothetical protein